MMSDALSFPVKYKAGHQYIERWIRECLYCPACGVKDVWRSDDGGDYYVGELHRCNSCEAKFYLPSGVEISDGDDYQDQQRSEAFKGLSEND